MLFGQVAKSAPLSTVSHTPDELTVMPERANKRLLPFMTLKWTVAPASPVPVMRTPAASSLALMRLSEVMSATVGGLGATVSMVTLADSH